MGPFIQINPVTNPFLGDLWEVKGLLKNFGVWRGIKVPLGEIREREVMGI